MVVAAAVVVVVAAVVVVLVVVGHVCYVRCRHVGIEKTKLDLITMSQTEQLGNHMQLILHARHPAGRSSYKHYIFRCQVASSFCR